MLEERVRQALRTTADRETVTADTAPTTADRARRRVVRNVVAAALVVAVLIGGSIGAIRSLSAPTKREPAVPAGSHRILFTDGRNVFSIGGDGEGLWQLTDCSAPECGFPAGFTWSPDGSQIAFARSPDKSDPVGDLEGPLLVMNADGSHLHKLTSCRLPTCSDSAPLWSPDGSRIAFERSGHDGGMFVIGSDGTDLARIADGPGELLAWSPDGAKVSFTNTTESGAHLLVAKVDGSGTRILHQVPEAEGPIPSSWSPEGDRIAYLVTPRAGNRFVAELHVIDRDGSNDRVVYRFECCLSSWRGPQWSSTGLLVLAIDLRGDGVGSWLYAVDPIEDKALALGRGTDFAWSPDGMALVTNDGGGHLTVIAADGSSTQVIATHVHGAPTWS
jgi:hypothetical protein